MDYGWALILWRSHLTHSTLGKEPTGLDQVIGFLATNEHVTNFNCLNVLSSEGDYVHCSLSRQLVNKQPCFCLIDPWAVSLSQGCLILLNRRRLSISRHKSCEIPVDHRHA